MHITNLRPVEGAGGALATFDVRLTPEIELRDWTLKRTANGWRSFQPRVREGRTPIWLAPHVLDEITQLARTQMEGDAHNDRSS
ncbi:hypothetical protein [Pelagibacterium mangrovi]|uniref:hypothetical protein n=1 Tax=Pelagibacterium mangrovi TaxID=3119828 RepID=UPI002FC6B9B9